MYAGHAKEACSGTRSVCSVVHFFQSPMLSPVFFMHLSPSSFLWFPFQIQADAKAKAKVEAAAKGEELAEDAPIALSAELLKEAAADKPLLAFNPDVYTPFTLADAPVCAALLTEYSLFSTLLFYLISQREFFFSPSLVYSCSFLSDTTGDYYRRWGCYTCTRCPSHKCSDPWFS